MRVAYLVDYYPPNHDGGDSIFARELAIALQDCVDLNVFTRHPLQVESTKRVDHGLTVNHLGEDWERVLNSQKRYDIIHFFQIDNIPMVHALQRQGPAKTLFHMQISFLRYAELNKPDYDVVRYHQLEQEAVALSNKVIIPSEGEVREVHRLFPTADLTVIPNGLDPKRFGKVCPPSYTDRWEYCFMGRIDDPMKGGDTLIDAISTLDQRTLDSMRFRFIGCRDERFMRGLERLDTELAYTIHCWTTDHSTLQETLDGTHFVVVPSRYETFGMVCLEGMCQGIVPIVSGAGAMGEMVQNGSGIRIAEVTSASIRKSLTASARLSSSEYLLMSRRAIERAPEYSIRKVATKVSELYESVVK